MTAQIGPPGGLNAQHLLVAFATNTTHNHANFFFGEMHDSLGFAATSGMGWGHRSYRGPFVGASLRELRRRWERIGMIHPKRKMVRLTSLTFAHAMRRLMQSPSSTADIVDASGLHRNTAATFLSSMIALDMAHECGRTTDSMGRMNTRLVAFGPKKNKDLSI